jgi:hypothetical protein
MGSTRGTCMVVIERFREAEVEDLDRAVLAHLHVGGLQVAMDDPVVVRGVERFRISYGPTRVPGLKVMRAEPYAIGLGRRAAIDGWSVR